MGRGLGEGGGLLQVSTILAGMVGVDRPPGGDQGLGQGRKDALDEGLAVDVEEDVAQPVGDPGFLLDLANGSQGLDEVPGLVRQQSDADGGVARKGTAAEGGGQGDDEVAVGVGGVVAVVAHYCHPHETGGGGGKDGEDGVGRTLQGCESRSGNRLALQGRDADRGRSHGRLLTSRAG